MSTRVNGNPMGGLLGNLDGEMSSKQSKLIGILNNPDAKPGEAKKAEFDLQQTMLKFESVSRMLDKIMDVMRLIVSKLDAR